MKKKANSLINETSPYLLQHAHNPVNWYPWGSEALDKAKQDDKPILVSIGYSACHWCHVMERESFENEDTASLMNQFFINIKIDREERPDLDQIYMDAVQAIAGNGGWPLNVFLTPDGKPFYGGTYFPPVKAFNRSSWTDIITGVHKLFIDKREEVDSKAEELTKFIGRDIPVQNNTNFDFLAGNNDFYTKNEQSDVLDKIMKQADTIWGGFGNAPKFPQTFTINTLLREYYYNKSQKALDQACLSLNKMIGGGIYDKLGGGFSRYSTDEKWLAPHFEKMLYDNALIIASLSDAYKITHDQLYAETVHQTVQFISRELKDVNGGYYAALDADSEGEEGKFYVWNLSEIQEALADNANLFCEYFDISLQGNWEGKNILRTLKSISEFCIEKNLDQQEFSVIIEKCKKILFNIRSERIRPATDDKIILGWNALLITALCKAATAFNNKEYLNIAISNFNFIKDKFLKNNSFEFYHNYKNSKAKNPAFLDDYAYLIEAAIHLQECTSDSTYLIFAKEVSLFVIENFSSSDLFYFTGKSQTDIIVRKKDMYDGAMPSGNAVMNHNLYYLGVVFDFREWKQKAIDSLLNYKNLVVTYPTSFGVWNHLLSLVSKGAKEIAIIGNNFEEYRDKILSQFLPDLIIQSAQDNNNDNFPLLKGKVCKVDETVTYFCRNYTCENPTSNIDEAILNILNN